jgi:hypothetical protein
MTSCGDDVTIVTVNPTPTLPGATATPTSSGFTVTITIGGGDGTGIVTANPPGPNYPPGTVVTVTATADAGSCFGGWTASCETFGRKAICTVTISASTKVGAEFDKVCSTPTPTYCHAITANGGCPSGATQYCDSVPIVATSSAQAQAACNACFGGGCVLLGTFWEGVLPPSFNADFYFSGTSCGVGSLFNAGDISNSGCGLFYLGRWAP